MRSPSYSPLRDLAGRTPALGEAASVLPLAGGTGAGGLATANRLVGEIAAQATC